MAKTTVSFEYGRDKGNNTGLGKNSNVELQEAMTQAVADAFQKLEIRGFRILFHVHGVIYSVLVNTDTMLQRAKLESDEKSLKVFAPFSRPQAEELAKNAYVVGTWEELETIREQGDGKKAYANNGIAVEYMLAKKLKKKFDHKKAWTEGRGEFGGYEVKFFDFGFDRCASSPRAKLTNRKQLEKLGYQF